MLAIPPFWASSKNALLRANTKPPVELVVADLGGTENGNPLWRLVSTFKVEAYDTVPKVFYSVPSLIANDGVFCRNEQSAMGILQWQTMTLAEWHQPRRAPTFDTQCQR